MNEGSASKDIPLDHLKEGVDISVGLPTALPNAFFRDKKPYGTPNEPLSAVTVSVEPVSNNDNSLTDPEEALPWDGYQTDPLPEKTQSRFIRNLRHQAFTIYRRLFGVVFIVNMAIFITVCIQGASVAKLGEITVANLFVAILMRQEYVINTLFFIFCSAPRSWPLFIRLLCARIYHIGGIHSGCGVSGVIWLILFTGKATRDFVEGGQVSVATLSITYVILLLLLSIVIFAFPTFRSKRHDTFECIHRFMGWTAIALVWIQIISLIMDTKPSSQSLAHALRDNPSFWLVVVLTASIILPWLRLRKVPIRSEVLSNHCIRLYFDYATPVPGSFIRMSTNPLMEWHGFATIKEPGKPGFSSIVSRAGDWTSKQIADSPTQMWIRGIPTCGVMRIVPLFRRVVVVATGSGIAPCAPHVYAKKTAIRLLWSAPNVRETFGDKLVDSILEASPDALIYDTRKHGKPDMVKLVARLVREMDAEAVCIISNPPLTRKVVYGMKSRGIPAFGAIWDS